MEPSGKQGVITSGSRKEDRQIYINDKYLKYFILGVNTEVGESRDGANNNYIRINDVGGPGITLKLPQSGVSFSTTSDKIHVDSASRTVTGLHAGTFDITMTVNGVSFTNQYTCWGKSFNDVIFSLEGMGDYGSQGFPPNKVLTFTSELTPAYTYV